MPDDKTRETLLEEAFTESGGKVGALTLRKFSLASVNLCKRMGISLVLDSRVLKGDVEAGVLPLDESELQRQLVSFIWSHHAPIDEVIDALEDGSWKRKVARFEFDLPLDAMPEMMEQLARVAQRAEAAAVEVVQKPGGKDEEGAPPKILEPGWTAGIVFTLARETGWTEHFIVWELPFTRALQYYHCALRSSLAWTVKPGPGVSEQLKRLESLAANIAAEDDEDA